MDGDDFYCSFAYQVQVYFFTFNSTKGKQNPTKKKVAREQFRVIMVMWNRNQNQPEKQSSSINELSFFTQSFQKSLCNLKMHEAASRHCCFVNLGLFQFCPVASHKLGEGWSFLGQDETTGQETNMSSSGRNQS